MIGKLEIVIGDQTHVLDPDTELTLDEEGINEYLKNQPSLYAFYAVMQEAADAQVAEAKLHLETLEATLDDAFRTEAAKSGTKITETLLANRIKVNDDYIASVIALNEAKRQVGQLRAIKDAFVHRKDMLVTLASNMRAQQDPEIFISRQKYKEKR